MTTWKEVSLRAELVRSRQQTKYWQAALALYIVFDLTAEIIRQVRLM